MKRRATPFGRFSVRMENLLKRRANRRIDMRIVGPLRLAQQVQIL